MNKVDLYKRLVSKYQACRENTAKWRCVAKKDYALYHGNQWDEEDIEALRCAGRPYLTFNQVMPLINAVIGSEINNRRVTKFVPRTLGDVKSNEMLTSVGNWFREEANGEKVDTNVFKDSLITGMGWSEVTLDYTTKVNGRPSIKRLDPFKMVWDSYASADNLKDAKYLFYATTLPIDQLEAMFPDEDKEEFLYRDDELGQETEDDDMYSSERKDDMGGLGTIIEARYKRTEPAVTYVDPYSGEEITASPKEYKEAAALYEAAAGLPLAGIRHSRTVVRRAFLGASKILGEEDEPLAPEGSFGWTCVTGFYDNTNKMYYGLVKALRDPQMCINKFFSEAVYTFNAQSKGGVMVEEDAVRDINEFAATYNMIGEVTVLRNGGLQRIGQKPVAPLNPAMAQLLNFSTGQISQVTGISQEFLGTRDVNQPGILEAHRKQSSLNILAPLFDNLKAYRKAQGEIILHLIQRYLSDGRLVRIAGEDKQQYVPLIRDNVADLEYDIIIDDEPLALNDSERNLQIITQFMPMIQPYMTPEVALQIMRYSPLPSELVDGLVRAYESGQQQQQASMAAQQQAQQQEAQLELAKKQLDNQMAAAKIRKMEAETAKEASLADKHSVNTIQDVLR